MKRFYKEVSLAPGEGGTRLLLDGRPVKTPGKKVLLLPKGGYANAVAEEWAAQGEKIDPATMTEVDYWLGLAEQNNCETLIFDGEHILAGLLVYGATVVQIDVETMAARRTWT